MSVFIICDVKTHFHTVRNYKVIVLINSQYTVEHLSHQGADDTISRTLNHAAQ